jgi:M6 family metalloprotease-like protein
MKRFTVSRWLCGLCMAYLIVLLTAVTATGHPVFGEQWKLRQPDGTLVDVKIWGDEFYQVVESLDGYTLTRDPSTMVICYARLAPGGNSLESTGVPIGTADPTSLGIMPHIRINPEARAEEVRIARGELDKQRDLALANRGITLEMVNPPITGNVEGLCLLADFSDQVATIPRADVVDYCNQVGYTGYGNNGSVRDYFYDCSNGNLTYTNWVSAAYFRASQPFSYYDDPAIPWLNRAVELIVDILNDMDANGFDFSQYDANGDGYIDAINLFYAGNTTAGWAKGMWPGSGWITDLWTADGVKTLKFQITGMGTSLGIETYCHENGHMIGFWPDLYDYDYDSTGIGNYCLMSNGGSGTNPCEPCAYLKYIAGWGNVTTLAAKQMGVSVPVSSTNTIFKFNNSGNAKEYYLIENRQKTGRDLVLPDAGLAVWHIDEDGDHNANEMLPGSHFLVTLVQADGRWDLEHNVNGGDNTDLWSSPGYTANTPCTDPNTNWWDGSSSGLMFENISALASTMTFDFSPADEVPVASCKDYSFDADENCCVTVNLSDVDNGSFDGNGPGDIDSFGITAVDATPVTLTDQVEICGEGMHTVTITMTDLCGNSASCMANVEVVNSPPVAVCKAFSDIADDDCCIMVDLANIDGGTYDPDGAADIETFGITAVDGTSITLTDQIELCGQGMHTVTITATDYCGETSSCDADVEVIDNTPPEITVTLSRDVLWPPNHKMADIVATVVVTDNCCAAPTFRLTKIESNEPDNGKGDGNTTDDIQYAAFGTADTAFQLRSERMGGGDGRIYTIVYTAEDCVGNTADDTVYVRVPHDHEGWAFASMGFEAGGLGFDPALDRFVLVIPSKPEEFGLDAAGNQILVSEAFDATALDVTKTYVGNARDVTLPIETLEVDNNADGLMDLALYYSAPAVNGIIAVSTPIADSKLEKEESYGPIGLHYRSATGTDYLVSNIFALGDPVPLIPPIVVRRTDEPGPDMPPTMETPKTTALMPAFPNPFNPSTTIPFFLTSQEHVTLRIYDARGKLVQTLRDEVTPPGAYSIVWNGRDGNGAQVATGVYFVRLRAGSYEMTRKIVMIK